MNINIIKTYFKLKYLATVEKRKTNRKQYKYKHTQSIAKCVKQSIRTGISKSIQIKKLKDS